MTTDSWEYVLAHMLEDADVPCKDIVEIEPLLGGVSSDIVRFKTSDGNQYCAKRALKQLKVAQEWLASTERNQSEIKWLKQANAIYQGCAPKVICESHPFSTVILEYLPKDDYFLWKDHLLAEQVDEDIATNVGEIMGHIHAKTLNQKNIATAFDNDTLFDQLRLDPYLRSTAKVHTDLSDKILAVLQDTATHKMALVHGDLSPKNILVNKQSKNPILLDAECAWYGDPAFDGAFLLTHFFLKSVYNPNSRRQYMQLARNFIKQWQSYIPNEHGVDLQKRTYRLLPCIILARIDGKSPVEYLDEPQRDSIRQATRALIAEGCCDLEAIVKKFAAL